MYINTVLVLQNLVEYMLFHYNMATYVILAQPNHYIQLLIVFLYLIQ